MALQGNDGWVVAISDDAFTLETTRYANSADDFRRRLEAALSALNEIVAPEAESRLGLRFIDIITTPLVAAPAEWRGRISDWLLAPALHPSVGPSLTALQQQLSLDLHEG